MNTDPEELLRKAAAEFEQRVKAQLENTSDLVKRAAEGFDATLGSIDRRLKRLEKKWDTRILDHERVLENHKERIEKLERAGN